VQVVGVRAPKPGTPLATGARVEVSAGPAHVGRGAVKLAGALEAFGVDPHGRVAVDVGASTGGFTEVLLERGARRVYAVDVGRGQLHERLRTDPRVVVRDGVNARHLSPADLGEACELAVMDASFISVLKLLPALRAVLAPAAAALVLVKPQFEAGRRQVGRGGLVRDPRVQLDCLLRVAHAAHDELGYAVVGVCASPITGASGNREFFLHLRAPGAPAPDAKAAVGLTGAALAAALSKAVEP
jgi:23S rRNA (cytidine1920-2'-O)/16S rRNA (cytidine1409-2'-O)-methyltransferase